MFYQVFLSSHVKRYVIITYKHDIHELPHELPNHLRLTNLRKLENIRKVSKPHRMAAKIKILLILAKFSKNRN